MEPLKKIAIIGVGLLGGSLGIAFKRNGCHVTGISREETIERAMNLGVIHRGFPYERMDEGLLDAEVVFLCTPISRIVELIKEIGTFLQTGAIVSDVGSTKRVIVSTAREYLPEGIIFIGGHPMAGSEKSGIEASDPFLFQNVIYVLSPDNSANEESINRFQALIESLGARVIFLTPHEHDAIASAVSHLPQMIAVTLVNLVGNLDHSNPVYLRMAAGGFRDLTRIAMSPFSMWKDILETNKELVEDIIDTFITELQRLKHSICSDKLKTSFTCASQIRTTIPRDTKGFMNELHDILVEAEDCPGEIANISNRLFKENINIKDIEVLKVREGEGGTLRLAFENEQAAARAVEVLTKSGRRARLRR